jgi:hypothetical protein
MFRPLIGISAAATLLAGASLGLAAPSKGKPAPKGKPAVNAALDPAQVIAQLRKDEAAIKTAHLTLTASRREGDLPPGVKGAAAWDAAQKLPQSGQRREILVLSGSSWKRDVTLMDEQGAPATHFMAGVSHRMGRMLRESGHGDQKTLNGVLGMDLSSDDHGLLL